MKQIYLAFIFLFISVKSFAQPCQTSTLWYVPSSSYAAVACFGDCTAYIDISTSGGTPPYTVIHPVSGNSIIYTSATTLTGFCVGTYDIIITDSGGCSETFSVLLTGPSSPLSVNPIYTPESFPGACDGSLYPSATGGVPTYNFNISPFVGDPSNVCAGNYTVCVSDANGCVECTAVMIGNSCTAQAGAWWVDCSGPPACDGELHGNAWSGAAPYTYAWFDCSFTTQFYNIQNPVNVCPGSYVLVVTDNNGCTDTTDCVQVGDGAPCTLGAIVSSVNVSAPGNCDGELNAIVTGGTSPFTFYWMNCAADTLLGTNQNEVNVCAGDYYLLVSDSNGCSDTTTCVATGAFVSTDDEPTKFNFSVYPNPATDLLILESNFDSSFRFELVNSLGQIVYASQEISVEKTSVSIQSLNLSEGLYFVRLHSDDFFSAMPLIIKAD